MIDQAGFHFEQVICLHVLSEVYAKQMNLPSLYNLLNHLNGGKSMHTDVALNLDEARQRWK